jgi:dolichol-phosphate mannosyltransferase
MISIVAPAYNEEEVISDFVQTVMEKLYGQSFSFELLVINDGSTDKTKKILTQLQGKYNNLIVVDHSENRGLGAGLLTGFKKARGDAIVTMDADLSHDPAVIPFMVQKIRVGYDIVIASRYAGGGGMEGVPAWRRLISRVANKLIRVVSGWKIKDISSGFRVYRASLIKDIPKLDSSFCAQAEILRELFKKTDKVFEYPFVLKDRKAGQSKMKYLVLIPKYTGLLFSLR